MTNTKSSTAIICLSPYSGGMEIDAIKLAKKLSPHTRITIIAKAKCFIANSCEEYISYNNIRLETISFRSSLSLSIIFGVRRIIQDNEIENVIFFGASELKSLYFSFLGLDINLIVRHGTTKSTPKKDWFHRLIYSKVNYHVSICEHLQKNVAHIIPFGQHTQSILIYSSLDDPHIKKIPHSQLTLVHIGRIASGKGQIDAIEACSVLYEHGIDFVFYLVGGFDEGYEQLFMSLYNSLPYKEKIVLTGFSNSVHEYYQKSDIFLFPSYGEGLSNAFLEGLSYGLVCICYENTSFPELKELGFYLHMCENKNVSSLQTALLKISQNFSSELSISSKNRVLASSLFNEKREIDQYLSYLR